MRIPAPHTHQQILEAVVAAWRRVLHIEIEPEDSFFAAGGTSLAAGEIAADIRRRLGSQLPTVGDVLGSATPRLLAERIFRTCGSAQARGRSLLGKLPVDQPARATVQQQAIWFLEQIDPKNRAYNTITTLALKGNVDEKRLEKCLRTLVDRHAILRTAFSTHKGVLVQEVEEDCAVNLSHMDASAASAAELRATISELGRVAFDIRHPPLVRWSLLRHGVDRFTLVQVEHHFVHDGWSMWILLTELAALYRACPREQLDLPPLVLDYQTYGSWQHRWLGADETRRSCALWADELKDAPSVLRFPFETSRPAVFTHEGDTLEEELPGALLEATAQAATRASVTPFAVLMAAFVVFLGDRAKVQDLVLGSMARNRQLPGSESVVGMFVNTIAIPFRNWHPLSFDGFAREVMAALVRAQDREQIPFPVVIQRLALARDLARNKLFQVCFSMNDWHDRRLDFGDSISSDVSFPSNGGAKFDLDVVLENPAHGAFLWRYYQPLFKPADVAAMAERYQRVLTICLEQHESPLGAISLDLSNAVS